MTKSRKDSACLKVEAYKLAEGAPVDFKNMR